MYEYDILNIHDGTKRIIFGYNIDDAVRRFNINPEDWKILLAVYVD